MSAAAPPSSDRPLKQYEVFMAVYQHHLDLIVKIFALYLTIVGSAVGVAFSRTILPQGGRALIGFAAALSVVAIMGLQQARAWGMSLRAEVRLLEDELETVGHFPFTGPVALLDVFIVAAGVVFVAMIVCLFFVTPTS